MGLGRTKEKATKNAYSLRPQNFPRRSWWTERRLGCGHLAGRNRRNYSNHLMFPKKKQEMRIYKRTFMHLLFQIIS